MKRTWIAAAVLAWTTMTSIFLEAQTLRERYQRKEAHIASTLFKGQVVLVHEDVGKNILEMYHTLIFKFMEAKWEGGMNAPNFESDSSSVALEAMLHVAQLSIENPYWTDSPRKLVLTVSKVLSKQDEEKFDRIFQELF
jgi:hypothetical protein